MLHRKTIELAEKKYRGNFKNWPRQNRKINNRICCEKSKVLKLSEVGLFIHINFYAPEIEDRGAYCFCPVCHSVIL